LNFESSGLSDPLENGWESKSFILTEGFHYAHVPLKKHFTV